MTATASTFPVAADRPAFEAPGPPAMVASTGGEVYQRLRDAGVELGPSLQCITTLWSGGGRHVADITAAAPCGTEFLTLDACLQVASLASSGDGGPLPLFVPVAAQAVHRYGPPTARMTCEVRITGEPDDEHTSTRGADIVLYDDGGRTIAAIDGLLLQRLGTGAERPDDWYYGIEWRPLAALDSPRPEPVGTWLVFADRDGRGEALAGELRGSGARCTVVSRAAEFARSAPDRFDVRPGNLDDLRLVSDSLAAAGRVEIAFLWGLDAPAGDPTSATDLELAQRLGCGALLDVIRTMVESGSPAPVWVVTAGVHRALPTDGGAAIAQAPLWGLGRAVGEELPDGLGRPHRRRPDAATGRDGTGVGG